MRRPVSNGRSALRSRLAAGERVIGTIVKLPSDEVVDVLAGAGFDFGMVDLEHSQLAEGEALRLLRHGYGTGFPLVARIAVVESRLVNRLLEAGAAGIQLSTIRRVEQVHALIAASRYAPAGRRSVSLNHPVAGYGAVGLEEAVGAEPALLIGQIETAETDDALDEIASAGLDVLFAGTVDITVDLGFDAERVAPRVKEIRAAADAAGLPFGAYAANAAALPDGVRYAVISADLSLLRSAATDAMKSAR
jgi:4-hydroxy-2-oxoheptanedioate aldolase